MTTPLFDQLVEASGIAPLIARPALERLMAREGLVPRDLRRFQIFAIRQPLRDLLSIYLRHAELEKAMERVQLLCRTTTDSMRRP